MQIPTSLIEALDNADDFTDLLQFLDKVPSFLVGEEADAIEHGYYSSLLLFLPIQLNYSTIIMALTAIR